MHSDSSTRYHHQPAYKVMIAGDGAVGKSTLITAKSEGKFQIGSRMTIGVDFKILTIPLNGKNINLQLWDLGGQERFQFIHDVYIKGAKAAFILYDLSRAKSFENIQKWFSLIYSVEPYIPIILVGTKKDLVSNADLLHYAMQWQNMENEVIKNENFLGHYHISSKLMENIDEIFMKLIQFLENHQNKSLNSIQLEQNCLIS